jgi:uncharacterized membrane protein YkvA (DUF1232 family)
MVMRKARILTRGDRRHPCGDERRPMSASPRTIFSVLQRVKQRARDIRRDVVALWIAARDSRVPWYAKLLAAAVAAYALSPIDLIPDFVPVLGYLDDLLIVPAGILLTIRLMPAGLVAELRAEAARREGRPSSRLAALIIVVLWILAIAGSVRWLRALTSASEIP